MSIEEDILIERFLKDKLSQEEKFSFEEKLISDPIFKEKYTFEKQLFETLNEDSWSFAKNINSSEVKEYEKLFRNPETLKIKNAIAKANKNYKDNNGSKNKKWFIYSGVATIALLISLYFFNITTPTSEKIYARYINTTEIPSIINRGDNNYQTLSQGQAYFNNKEYQKSEKLFSKELKNNTTNSSVYLFLAISQIELQQFKKAEETLNLLIKSNLIDAEKGYWFKSLLYLKSKEISKAKTILEVIISNKYYNYKKAKELLEKLDKL